MLGRTVFVILLGFLIAGTGAPNDKQTKMGKMIQKTSEEKVKEDLLYALAVYKGLQHEAQDNITISFAEGLQHEEQDNITISFAEDSQHEEQENLTINFAEEIVPEVITNPEILNKFIAREFFPPDIEIFTKITSSEFEERNILSKVEFLYQIRGKSPISHRNLGIPRTQDRAFALVYITFLSFFELLNFRVVFLHYSIVHLPNAEYIKPMCDVYFRGLTMAFKEFKNSLKYFIQNQPEFNLMDKILQNVAKQVVTLSTDLVMDVDDLNNQHGNPDEYISELINWNEVPLHWNFRSIFPSVSEVKERVIAAVGEGSELNSVTVLKYIAKMTNVCNWNKLANIQQWFIEKIFGINNNELLTLNFKPAVLCKYLKGDEFYIPDDGDMSVQNVIKSALELIYKLRNMDFAILHDRLLR